VFQIFYEHYCSRPKVLKCLRHVLGTIFLAEHSNFKKDFTRVYEPSIYSTSLKVVGTYVTFFPLQIPTLVLLLYASYIKPPWNDKWKECIIVSARNVFGWNEKYNKPAAVWRYHTKQTLYIIHNNNNNIEPVP